MTTTILRARNVRCAILVLVAGSMTACTTAHMPLPDTMGSADPMVVSGRQGFKIKEALAFGSFEATDIDRSWVKGGDLQVSNFETGKRRQQYTFQLRDVGVDKWFVSCEAFLRQSSFTTDIVDIEIKNRSSVNCYLSASGDLSDTWTLMLEEKRDRPLAGQLANKTHTLDVQGTKKLAGGLPAESTTGYEFSIAENAVAAVEVINQGSVWLSSQASDHREVLAASAAALLLLEDLRAHMPTD